MSYPKDMVVYQIYPRSFCDTNGDGIGDLPGIISKLDYLQDLGVNNIWLSPVYPSPDRDNGYDIADYQNIDPKFGTLEDFDVLVAEAKKRGIGIVMDLVINHTSDQHQWFQKALAGDPVYQDYYIIREGKDGKLPNNWGNFFAECPWTPFGDTGKYYLHLFAREQPDLNWRNPAVLEEIKNILRFWLERGVAGFRCDVINIIYKNTLADGKPSPILTGMEHYLSTDGCHRILRELRKVLDEYGAFTVGETVFVDVPKAKDLTDPARGELDMVFAFEHMEVDQVIVKWFKTWLSPRKLMKCLVKWQTELDWNACYFENHDQPRFISRFSDLGNFRREASMMMAGLQMTLRGTPYVFEGQELGMTNCDFADMSEIADIESHNIWEMARRLHIPKGIRWKMILRTSRDQGRTPMQWDSSENAGFTTGRPWLRTCGNYREVNAADQMADEKSVRAFWKYMIDLRKTDPALIDGAFIPAYMGRSVFAYERYKDGRRLLAVCNLCGKERKLPAHLADWENLVACNYDTVTKSYLRPFEFRLLEEVGEA